MGSITDGYNPDQPTYDPMLVQGLKSMIPSTAEEGARFAADSFPISGVPLALNDSLNAFQDGDNVGGAISLLGATPLVGGIIKRAPDRLLRKAIAYVGALVSKGVSKDKAIKKVFNKTGVDISADRNFNYDVNDPTTPIDAHPADMFNSKRLRNTKVLTDPKLGSEGTFIPSENTISIHPRAKITDKQFRNVKSHESQHAYDRNTSGLDESLKRYDANLDSITTDLKDINDKMLEFPVGSKEHDLLVLSRARKLRDKRITNLTNPFEMRARAVGNSAHQTIAEKDTISSRIIKEFNIDKYLFKEDRNVSYAQTIIDLRSRSK